MSLIIEIIISPNYGSPSSLLACRKLKSLELERTAVDLKANNTLGELRKQLRELMEQEMILSITKNTLDVSLSPFPPLFSIATSLLCFHSLSLVVIILAKHFLDFFTYPSLTSSIPLPLSSSISPLSPSLSLLSLPPSRFLSFPLPSSLPPFLFPKCTFHRNVFSTYGITYGIT